MFHILANSSITSQQIFMKFSGDIGDGSRELWEDLVVIWVLMWIKKFLKEFVNIVIHSRVPHFYRNAKNASAKGLVPQLF